MDALTIRPDFKVIENILALMIEDHSPTTLMNLKLELNKVFPMSKCRDILYTENTDKLFFGIKVYPMFDGYTATMIMGDQNLGNINKFKAFESYYVEFDSKLFDPMLMLDERELTALLVHDVANIICNTETLNEVRKQIDMYYAETEDCFDPKMPKGYSELLAYAIIDSLVKVGSVFSKIGNEDVIADKAVTDFGYAADYESAVRKIARSETFMNKSMDERLIALSWVLRLKNDYKTRALPAIKTLRYAKDLTASELEKRELNFAISMLNTMEPFRENYVDEGFFENVKARFSKKFDAFKLKGIRSIKNDVYELSLRMRAAESEMDLLYIIRTVNTDVAILRDYLTEDIPEEERAEVLAALQDLYAIREKCAKDKEIKDRYDSLIQVAYTS